MLQVIINDCINFQDLKIVIENKAGSLRYGKQWVQKMAHDYGYIKNTIGADGDEIDCFVGPNEDSEFVFIVEQVKENGEFDEHKVMLGFSNIAEAKDAYFANYPQDWDGFKGIVEVDDFWEWYKANSNKKENKMGKTYRMNDLYGSTKEKFNRGKLKYSSQKVNASDYFDYSDYNDIDKSSTNDHAMHTGKQYKSTKQNKRIDCQTESDADKKFEKKFGAMVAKTFKDEGIKFYQTSGGDILGHYDPKAKICDIYKD